MKIRSMIAAAVRPWISVQSGAKYVKITVGDSAHGKPHAALMIKDTWSGNDAPTLWLGASWFHVGELTIGVAHSESRRKSSAPSEKPANDSAAAA